MGTLAKRIEDPREIADPKGSGRDALRELGGSGLIRSNSLLLQGDAKAALTTLKLAEEATLAAGVRLNSEYFRQFGVALFQTRQDAMAKTMFERAMATIPDVLADALRIRCRATPAAAKRKTTSASSPTGATMRC